MRRARVIAEARAAASVDLEIDPASVPSSSRIAPLGSAATYTASFLLSALLAVGGLLLAGRVGADNPASAVGAAGAATHPA